MQLGFFFNQPRCSGCEACLLACRQWHGDDESAVDLLAVTELETGEFPDVAVTWMVVPCLHCAEPVCAEACPAQAIVKSPEDGRVTVDMEKCMGKEDCGAVCREVCPYQAPRFKDEPDAKMQKCDLCLDRMKEGKKPICVAACPMRALDVAPLPELESAWGKAKDAEGFVYSAETAPSIVIRAK
ncbi:4Fe-4S dicluster domain-containing protein [Thermodesulfobacteriota bacterium]